MNAALATPSGAPPETERMRILVVEDDPVVRRLLRLRLHRAGLVVASAVNGEEAVQLAEDTSEPIHLVITDGVMPGIDGFEVARRFGQSEPPVPVILLSGYLNHFVSRTDIPANIEAFFAKPFSGDELVAKILDILGVSA
jgi:two-component system, cell cycle sensor histidine kinase and response regulator CckA